MRGKYNNMNVYNIINKIIKIVIILNIIVFLNFCTNTEKIVNNYTPSIENINSYEIELFDTDFNIIKYIENNELEIEITNQEIILQLNNLVNSNENVSLVNFNPIIYITINEKKYLTKGMWIFSSSIPKNYDFICLLNVDGKIMFKENNIIEFKNPVF